MTNKPQHREHDDQPDQPEQGQPPSRSRQELHDAEVATRGAFQEWAHDEKDTEAVKLTSPTGTKVTVSREAAEDLRKRGYK
jgi:hypothetical protein